MRFFKSNKIKETEIDIFWDQFAKEDWEPGLDDGEPDLDTNTTLELSDEHKLILNRIHDQLLAKHRQSIFKTRFLQGFWTAAAILLVYFTCSNFLPLSLFKTSADYVSIIGNGHIQSILLPDGSKATLSPGACLRYPRRFNSAQRDVFLDRGECFFEVTKNSDQPFVVHTEELETTALGTSFTVRCDPDKKSEKIKLYTGKVLVKNTHPKKRIAPVVLEPGRSYENLAGKIILDRFNSKSENPMLRGLNFENYPIDLAIAQIEFWYGIHLVLPKPGTKQLKINGDFSNMSLDEVLMMLALTYDTKFTKTDSLTYKMMKEK